MIALCLNIVLASLVFMVAVLPLHCTCRLWMIRTMMPIVKPKNCFIKSWLSKPGPIITAYEPGYSPAWYNVNQEDLCHRSYILFRSGKKTFAEQHTITKQYFLPSDGVNSIKSIIKCSKGLSGGG